MRQLKKNDTVRFEKKFNQSGEELIYRGGLMLTYKIWFRNVKLFDSIILNYFCRWNK